LPFCHLRLTAARPTEQLDNKLFSHFSCKKNLTQEKGWLMDSFNPQGKGGPNLGSGSLLTVHSFLMVPTPWPASRLR
jgi:hypothetical protein